MIERDDLRSAVNAGVLTEAQATRLIGMAEERQGLRNFIGPSDEPFELFQGMNELFIVLGLAILFGGWSTFFGLSASDDRFVFGAVLALVVIFLSARYFTLTRRMVAPSIALAVMFGLSLVQLGLGASELLKLAFQHKVLLVSGVSFLGLGLYWAVYRVPFTLALIGIAGIVVLYALALLGGAAVFDIEDAFLLTGDGPFALLTIAGGVVLLIFAMRYDLSDPHRVTRRAANGFWLHIVAAPAIMNTVSITLLDQGTIVSNLALLAFLGVIAIFAIIIDRRSFLMAAAGYAVALSLVVFKDGSPVVVLILGLVLVILGAKWEAIRGSILARAPEFPFKGQLPPWTRPEEKQD